jgi:beta-carotene hydroxylase
MLKYKADWRSLAYLTTMIVVLVAQWNIGFNPFLFVFSLYLAITASVIAHNHNHVPMWKNQTMNTITDYWITLFYGFPVFAWIPTHNRNHHHYTNREGDYTITYRFSEKNNLGTVITYPAISSYFQKFPITAYLQDLWMRNRSKFYTSIGQGIALVAFMITALVLDWQKALLYVIIPHQVSTFSVLVFNYIQHVHADEESEYNHSRNFVSAFTNFTLFNNGLHTAHHIRANTHWSEVPALHAKIDHLIDDSLKERGFWPYMIRTYLVAPIVPSVRRHSMRLQRMAHEAAAREVASANNAAAANKAAIPSEHSHSHAHNTSANA